MSRDLFDLRRRIAYVRTLLQVSSVSFAVPTKVNSSKSNFSICLLNHKSRTSSSNKFSRFYYCVELKMNSPTCSKRLDRVRITFDDVTSTTVSVATVEFGKLTDADLVDNYVPRNMVSYLLPWEINHV